MEELWKDVKGYEEYYKVSNLGRVYSKDRFINNNGTMVFRKGRYLTGTCNGLGYFQCSFTVNGKTVRKYIHRLVAKMFISNYNELPDVNHKDGDKSNNEISNLEWISKSDNTKHAIDNGLLVINRKNGRFAS